MKAILIKTNHEDYHRGHYFLNNYDRFAIGSTDHEWCKRVSKPQYKLSKQNCDEIFGVVDVEKLFNEVDETIDFSEFCFTSFELGFNKAMELYQPTEVEVEIEMEVVPDFYSRSDEDGSIFTSNKKEQPKLDPEGCLILKRVV